ncbi:UNVERIFIED_CONTAM: Peroxidase 4 [Sesamum radiatum]|uniref:Peroxidase n=1 Tax=Sesamum radiatum TaxID=300843 RepID=A0AAW2UQR4_SESRA
MITVMGLFVVLAHLQGSSSTHLSTDFYEKSCPRVFGIVKSVVKSAVMEEKRMGASLLRLHFHDCFVQGCDGSILLDDTPSFKGEKTAGGNNNSVRGYEVIDDIKSKVEAVCPGIVSCADIVTIAARDSVLLGCDGSILLDDTPSFTGEKTAGGNNNSVRGYEVIDDIKSKVEAVCPGIVSCADIVTIAARDSVLLLGGPNWKVKVGRRDSKTASLEAANSGVLPAPDSNLTTLIQKFKDQGLSPTDLVALSGTHTIGRTRCVVFRGRIYNDTNIDASFAKKRQRTCPRTVGLGDDNFAPLDNKTPRIFDNAYFKNLIAKKGLLHSDQALYDGGSTDSLVELYSKSPESFNKDLVVAMIKMGDISPLTGSNGEIRKNCRKPN